MCHWVETLGHVFHSFHSSNRGVSDSLALKLDVSLFPFHGRRRYRLSLHSRHHRGAALLLPPQSVRRRHRHLRYQSKQTFQPPLRQFTTPTLRAPSCVKINLVFVLVNSRGRMCTCIWTHQCKIISTSSFLRTQGTMVHTVHSQPSLTMRANAPRCARGVKRTR